jgi:nucleoside transporter
VSVTLRLRLSLMMFLQYFMFGAWFVTLGTYMSKGLHFDRIIGTAYSTQGVAAIASTLLIGAIADRYVAAQKVLGVLAVLSGLTLLVAASVHASQQLFLLVVLLHFLCFIPTIALTNTITLGSVSDRSRQYPPIRVVGTLGWIVAGLLVGLIPGAAETNLPLRIAGCGGLLFGAYAFTLPAVPPRAHQGKSSWLALLGLDVILRIRDRNFWIFIVGVLLLMIPLCFYNSYCNNFLVEAGAHLDILGKRLEPTAIQTLGQGAEFILLLLLPAFLRRFGIKGVLVLGTLGWTIRYTLFAYAVGPQSTSELMLCLGVLVHGICYDFFFIGGQIYVDQRSAAAERTRAQAFLVAIYMGVGVIFGSNVANIVYDANALSSSQHDWRTIWLIPAAIAAATGIMLSAAFKVSGRVGRSVNVPP